MKNSSLVSISILFLLVSVSAAQAVPVTFNNTQYNITSVTGSFDDNSALLMNQPWWGDEAAAGTFSALSFEAGLLNTIGSTSLRFAYMLGAPFQGDDTIFNAFTFFTMSGDQFTASGGRNFTSQNLDYAVAEELTVSVPEPASAMLLMLGLAGFVATKRKGKQAAS